MGMPTLLDIAKRNASDLAAELIDEAAKYAPEVRLGAARTIRGRSYRQLVRKSLPSFAFRNANEGSAISKSEWENRLVETFVFNPQWECDKAVADSSEDGPDAYIADEADGIMQAALQHLGKVFYYGTNATFGDAKAFPALVQCHNADMVVDAGGTTDNVATSVWAVAWGDRLTRWVWGENGSLDLSDVETVRLTDASSNPYTGYRQTMTAYAGLQLGHSKCVGRIKKLTTDSGKGLTDALIFSLLAKFPVAIVPDMLLMTMRSLEQLRASRTATSPTGSPAPYPEYIQGLKQIPIVVTESIVNTETLAL